MFLKINPFGVENAKQETVEIQKHDRVSLLRQRISKKYGTDKCPADRLRLIYMGKVLEDSNADGTDAILYNTYGVREGMVILAMLKPIVTPEPELTATTGPTASTTIASTSDAPADAPADAAQPEAHVTSKETEPKSDPEIIPLEEEAEWICPRCKNNPLITSCKECGCQACALKDGNPLVCDQCEMYWHMACVGLEVVPEGDWYCPDCQNKDVGKVITEGQGIDQGSSKKAKMPSAKQTKRWGGGMACVGKETSCIIVDSDHIGPIPGVYVGQTWKFRMQVSEWGVHRPPVGGIAGGKTGCTSIVLAAGYPEDIDNGDEFTYTGSGGRDLKTGNRRVASQTTDQALDRFNLSMAMTCAAGVHKNGADAGDDWKKSRPIRVVRSDKLAKHNPKYAPEEGQRYDGLYKMVKYYKGKGESGHVVWRFLMRRDDPDPAPWTEAGKRRIHELGLRIIRQDKLDEAAYAESDAQDKKGKTKAKVDSRKLETAKLKRYAIPADVAQMMKEDTRDERIWEDVMAQECWSEYEFLHYVFNEAFACCVCSTRITNPVTTPCGHVACQTCLQKAGKTATVCPSCRSELKDPTTGKVSYAVNRDLLAILKKINWAYAGGVLPSRYGSDWTATKYKGKNGVAKDAKENKGKGKEKAPPQTASRKMEKRKAVEEEEEVDELEEDDDSVQLKIERTVTSPSKRAKVVAVPAESAESEKLTRSAGKILITNNEI